MDSTIVGYFANEHVVYIGLQTNRGEVEICFPISDKWFNASIKRSRHNTLTMYFDDSARLERFTVLPTVPMQYKPIDGWLARFSRRIEHYCLNIGAIYTKFDEVIKQFPNASSGRREGDKFVLTAGYFIIQHDIMAPYNPFASIGQPFESKAFTNLLDMILPMPISDEIKEQLGFTVYVLA
jgi:hypothetical protein